jgi:hypothetical protein
MRKIRPKQSDFMCISDKQTCLPKLRRRRVIEVAHYWPEVNALSAVPGTANEYMTVQNEGCL